MNWSQNFNNFLSALPPPPIAWCCCCSYSRLPAEGPGPNSNTSAIAALLHSHLKQWLASLLWLILPSLMYTFYHYWSKTISTTSHASPTFFDQLHKTGNFGNYWSKTWNKHNDKLTLSGLLHCDMWLDCILAREKTLFTHSLGHKHQQVGFFGSFWNSFGFVFTLLDSDLQNEPWKLPNHLCFATLQVQLPINMKN